MPVNPAEWIAMHPSLYSTLNLVTSLMKPSSYLEVGVCEGVSLSTVIKAGGKTLHSIVLCDNWGGEFGGTGKGNHKYIDDLLYDLDYRGKATFVDGDSHRVLKPAIAGMKFDLILVDGDHSEIGATQDLYDCYPHLRTYGLLLFDDLYHAAHPWLKGVIDKFVQDVPEFEIVTEMTDPIAGVAILRRK